MRKTISILVLAYISLGTMLTPMGDMSYLSDLHRMYAHCALEDPDITPCDFVLEHLMNMQDVAEFFEGESSNETEQEKSHQQYFSHPVSPVVAVCPVAVRIHSNPQVAFISSPNHPLTGDAHIANGHLSEVFRPPVLA